MRHRLRRDRGAAQRRSDERVTRAARAPRDGGRRASSEFARHARAARARRCAASRASRARDNIAVRRLRARLARDRRHRLARRVSVRRRQSRHRGGSRADRARAASISGSRSFRAAAAPATPAARFRSTRLSAVINTEKLESAGRDRARRAARASTRPVPVIRCGAGVVTRARDGSGRRGGPGVRVDPTSADASCIGGNVAMNAGGKKAVLWGTALDNLASWRMVTPDARVARGRAPRPQPRQDPRRADARASALRAIAADGKTLLGERDPRDSRRARSARRASARTSPTRCSPACPACRRKAATASSPRRRFILHRMPPHVRTVCLEFFGTVREAVPAIVEIKRLPRCATRRRAARRASSTSTSAT